jgi:FlaA1/EpsC-like NDP-sugar epimerase
MARFMASFDPYSRTNQVVIDTFIFAASFVSAWLIRFEGWPDGVSANQLMFWAPILVLTRLLVHSWHGVYRFVWKFVSLSDAVAIAWSLGLPTAGLLILRLAASFVSELATWAVPLSIIALEFLLSLSGSLAVRAVRRMLYETRKQRTVALGRRPVRTLLYGAGQAGILLFRDLHGRQDIEVVGFVDDDARKVGRVICGKPVLGIGKQLAELKESASVDEVVISIATASRKTLTRIALDCRRLGIPAKIIPSLDDIMQGRVHIGELQELHIDDLLGRSSVDVEQLDEKARECYRGKRILVTGGGGSIGSELVRQLVRIEPAAVAILDKDENSVYELQQELLLKGLPCPLETQIADVRNPERLRVLFAQFRPEIIFHAAAHKHVPLMEQHPCEAILNNVIGTRNVLEASRRNAVKRFVFISTDKAVNPSSIMGASKRVGELLVQSFATTGDFRAACVRFGNVLGSRGSIIPLFQKQIAQGGPITVTHPDVVRFFMTIPEAVQLILCAGTQVNRGELFVLDMGNPRKIIDLASELALRAELNFGRNIKIAFTGLRPGEKLFEELTTSSETLQPTPYEKLSMICPGALDQTAFHLRLAELERAAESNNSASVYDILTEMNIGFQSHREQSSLAA